MSRITGGVVDGRDSSGAARPHPHHPARHHVAAGEVRVTWFVHFSRRIVKPFVWDYLK